MASRFASHLIISLSLLALLLLAGCAEAPPEEVNVTVVVTDPNRIVLDAGAPSEKYTDDARYCQDDADCTIQRFSCDCSCGSAVNIYNERQLRCDKHQPLCSPCDQIAKCFYNRCRLEKGNVFPKIMDN